MDESTPLGTQDVPADGFMQPAKRRLKLRCLRCGKVYYSKPFVVVPRDDPPCPRRKCAIDRAVEERLANDERFQKMIAEERAPGLIGDKPVVKAIDETAKIVMTDYNLTNLSDSMRQGDTAIPKLPPQQQQAADGFFSPQARATTFGGRRMAARVARMGAMALANGGAAFKGSGAQVDKIQRAQAPQGERALVPDHVDQGLTKLTVRRAT